MNPKSPTYYLDLKDKETRSRIESAKPGLTVQVRVRCEEAPGDESLVAKGTRSMDGAKFYVLVETSDGCWSHERDWEELNLDVNALRD